jgi:hypothetical protein
LGGAEHTACDSGSNLLQDLIDEAKGYALGKGINAIPVKGVKWGYKLSGIDWSDPTNIRDSFIKLALKTVVSATTAKGMTVVKISQLLNSHLKSIEVQKIMPSHYEGADTLYSKYLALKEREEQVGLECAISTLQVPSKLFKQVVEHLGRSADRMGLTKEAIANLYVNTADEIDVMAKYIFQVTEETWQALEQFPHAY